MPDYKGFQLTPAIESAERTLRGPKADTALPRKNLAVLQAMCNARGLSYEGVTREVLAKRLISWVSLTGRWGMSDADILWNSSRINA